MKIAYIFVVTSGEILYIFTKALKTPNISRLQAISLSRKTQKKVKKMCSDYITPHPCSSTTITAMNTVSQVIINLMCT